MGRDGDRNERVKLLLKDLAMKDAEMRDLKEKLNQMEMDIQNKARLFKTDKDRLETRNKELEQKIKTLLTYNKMYFNTLF